MRIIYFTVWNIIIGRNEQNNNQIEIAWKNIFATLEKKMSESDDDDNAATNENNKGNNDDPIESPEIESVPSPTHTNLVEDSASTITKSLSAEQMMERKNDLFKELSMIEDTMLNYFKTLQRNIGAASSSALLERPETHSKPVINDNGKRYDLKRNGVSITNRPRCVCSYPV